MTLVSTATKGSGAVALLFDKTLTGAAASIDTSAAGGISGAYSVLEIWLIAVTNDAAVAAAIDVTVNNDGSAIYDFQQLRGTNSAVSANALLADTRWQLTCRGTGGSALYPTIHRITIPGYAQTTFWKVGETVGGMTDATAANDDLRSKMIGYRSTSAISQVKMAAQGAANLIAGCRMSIYGLS